MNLMVNWLGDWLKYIVKMVIVKKFYFVCYVSSIQQLNTLLVLNPVKPKAFFLHCLVGEEVWKQMRCQFGLMPTTLNLKNMELEMFEKFAEIYIEGSVWSDYSYLIGQSIQYEADDGSINEGVVQSLSVGDIWEERMVTKQGAFLDVYAEIGKRLVCVGMLNLFGHGWNWGQIRQVTDWLEVHGFQSVTTPIRIPSRLDVKGLQGMLENEYLNVQVSLDQSKLTIVFTPQDRMGWDCREFRSALYFWTTEDVSVSDVHSRFDSDANVHFVHLAFDLGGE
jgi:hypothetical protein